MSNTTTIPAPTRPDAYLRSDVIPMQWVASPFEATVFDARDNREIKARILGDATRQPLVALDL